VTRNCVFLLASACRQRHGALARRRRPNAPSARAQVLDRRPDRPEEAKICDRLDDTDPEELDAEALIAPRVARIA
jgi:hypothetical protein